MAHADARLDIRFRKAVHRANPPNTTTKVDGSGVTVSRNPSAANRSVAEVGWKLSKNTYCEGFAQTVAPLKQGSVTLVKPYAPGLATIERNSVAVS